MKKVLLIILLFLLFPAISLASGHTQQPFPNSAKISTDIINEDDVTTYLGLTYKGKFERTLYDSRIPGWITVDAFVFTTTYSDGSSVEFQLNPEFGTVKESRTEVRFYAPVIGQLPFVLRAGIDTVTLHKGEATWTGSPGNINIHTDATPILIGPLKGVFEEAVIHEAGHASLDPLYKETAGWLQAQEDDGKFISTYAYLYPETEDLTESFLAYIALRTRFDRISEETATIIAETIPARIAYFDSLGLEMAPFEYGFLINAGLSGAWFNADEAGQGFYMEVLPVTKRVTLGWYTYDTERPSPGVTAIFGDPGHRWVTTLGPYVGNTTTMTIYQTQGGVLGQLDPPTDTDLNGDGTMTIEFTSCTEAIMRYEITSLGISKEMPIQRIAHDNVPLCEMLSTPFD